MKKLLILPLVIAFVAVPAYAMAQNNAEVTRPVQIKHASHRQKPATKPSMSALESSIRAEQLNRNNVATTTAATTTTTTDPATETTISLSDAKVIAQNLYPDKTIMKTELETENGIQVFEVKFTDGTEVNVNAADGSIVPNENETKHKKTKKPSERHYEQSVERSHGHSQAVVAHENQALRED